MLKGLTVLSASILTGCSYLTPSQPVWEMPAVTRCERELPKLEGTTNADIIKNRADTWKVYQECRDDLDLIIDANQVYEEAR